MQEFNLRNFSFNSNASVDFNRAIKTHRGGTVSTYKLFQELEMTYGVMIETHHRFVSELVTAFKKRTLICTYDIQFFQYNEIELERSAYKRIYIKKAAIIKIILGCEKYLKYN